MLGQFSNFIIVVAQLPNTCNQKTLLMLVHIAIREVSLVLRQCHSVVLLIRVLYATQD